MKKITKVILIIIAVLIVVTSGLAAYLEFVLPDVEPAPEITVEQTAARVERGKYLVNYVAACMVCHTHRDFEFFGGPVDSAVFGAGGDRLDRSMAPGRLYTTNITPYVLKDWTDGEILRAITSGVTKEGDAMFPVMPYERYGKMDTEDKYAMVAYLRTLTPVQKDVPESHLGFPMNFWVNTMPSDALPGNKPDTSNTVAYGEYLVTIANCIQCHSGTDNYKMVPDTEFGGGQKFSLKTGDVFSANITPDPATGIGNWTKEYFISQFKKYSDSAWLRKKVNDDEYNSPMPWLSFAYMTEKDLSAIYDYLRTVKPINNKVEKWKPYK